MAGGILSQDEINALLNGMDLSGDSAPVIPEELLANAGSQEPPREDYLSGMGPVTGGEELLTDVEKDAIGEVANISMGSSATTLYSLVNNHKVDISTPVVTLATWDSLIETYEEPCVFVQIKYTKGLDGSNILVLDERDVKIITDLMMGGNGVPAEGELSELHLSAISEAMNQMMGSAATSLSTMLQTTIDISPPVSSLLNLMGMKSGGEIAPFLDGVFVKITFRMQIGDLVDSKIMQLYPVEFAKKLVETFINTQMGMVNSMEEPAAQQIPAKNESPVNPQTGMGGSQPSGNMSGIPGFDNIPNMGDMNPMLGGMGGMPGMNAMGMNPMNNAMGTNSMGMNGMPGMNPMMNGMPGMNAMGTNPMMNGMPGMNPMMNGMPGMNPMGMNPMMNAVPGMEGMNPMGMSGAALGQGAPGVSVQPAQFQSFTQEREVPTGHENINLIMDVPLEVTVELGRTSKSISDILNFAPGTIIELDRIAGEPIDVLVNGKFVAKGEVVVIEESFGVRVTEIIK